MCNIQLLLPFNMFSVIVLLLVTLLEPNLFCFAYDHDGLVNTGHSAQYRSDDGYGNYEFGYNEDHSHGGTFRKEKGGPGYQVGSYGLRDADGRMRIVHYIADEHGFRATITTNEPGVDVKQDPAATSLRNDAYDATPIAAPIASSPHHIYQKHHPNEHHSVALPSVEENYEQIPLQQQQMPSSRFIYSGHTIGHSSLLPKESPYLAVSESQYTPALSGTLMATAYEDATISHQPPPPSYSAAADHRLSTSSHYYDPGLMLSNGQYGQRIYKQPEIVSKR